MKKILIVDDAVVVHFILRKVLTTAGYDVVGVVENGLEVIDRVKATKSEVVILDLGIPGKDGMQVLKELKADMPGVRVIICSAICLDSTIEEATNLGADGYLVKPVDAADLLSTLTNVLEKTV